MIKLHINVSDNANARDYHMTHEFKGKKNRAVILAPGRPRKDEAANLKIKHTIDFTYGWLFANLAKGKHLNRDIIIKDFHILSDTSLNNLIKFCYDQARDLTLYGASHNASGGVYHAVDYMANQGYDIVELENFVAPSPAIGDKAQSEIERLKKRANYLEKVKADLKKAVNLDGKQRK